MAGNFLKLCSGVFMLSTLCLLQVHSQKRCPNRRLNYTSGCTECLSGLDMSTDCSTCMGSESIECTEDEENCIIGNFTFSAQFHSYSNPLHMCGECRNRMVCAMTGCGLRFLYCLQPHGSGVLDAPLPAQAPIAGDDITFEDDPIVQGSGLNLWSRSNPFSRELRTWPGRVQFFIVVYFFVDGTTAVSVVDRLQIDLELNATTAASFTERETYIGLLNISRFDLSFSVHRCPENYYGSDCTIFCSEVIGESTCDSEGNTVCVNSSRDPANCSECLEMDRDPQNNCEEEPPATTAETITETTGMSTTLTSRVTSSSASAGGSGALVGGVVGGVLGGVLLLIIVVLIVAICCLCMRRRKGSMHVASNGQELPSEVATLKEPRQFVNPVYGNEEEIKEAMDTSHPGAAETAGYSTIDQPQYDTIDQPHYSVLDRTNEKESKFNNPIYGEEVTSNNVYSTTSHSDVQTSSMEASSQLPLAEYDALALPQYETPFSSRSGSSSHSHSGKMANASPHYEEADVVPESNPTPSATIYSEIEEEHAYSVLQN